ncbi:putative armadillo repeat protein ABAP1/ARIA [Helianthus annuus]|nr:putative armadillo repeat protein ABAP1/ARIA [Helianthus annuus]
MAEVVRWWWQRWCGGGGGCREREREFVERERELVCVKLFLKEKNKPSSPCRLQTFRPHLLLQMPADVPEHQQLIVDAEALPHLVTLLKRHKDGEKSRAVIRRAADAITNLAHENSNIKTRVRVEGGIPPLVELLEFADAKVQRAAAGALRTLAFKNEENKTLVGN